jgi:hypothetical protein
METSFAVDLAQHELDAASRVRGLPPEDGQSGDGFTGAPQASGVTVVETERSGRLLLSEQPRHSPLEVNHFVGAFKLASCPK